MKFEIGEIAIVIDSNKTAINIECEIVALPGHNHDDFFNDQYIINIPSCKSGNSQDGSWGAEESWLGKKKPPEEIGSWEDCIWRPEGVTV